MVTIDGDEIVSGSTIDGDEISEITMDGDVVWTGTPNSVVLDDWLDGNLTSNRDDFNTTPYQFEDEDEELFNPAGSRPEWEGGSGGNYSLPSVSDNLAKFDDQEGAVTPFTEDITEQAFAFEIRIDYHEGDNWFFSIFAETDEFTARDGSTSRFALDEGYHLLNNGRLDKLDGGSSSTVVSGSDVSGSEDFRIIRQPDGEFEVFYRDNGSWNLIGTGTDTTFTNPQYTAFNTRRNVAGNNGAETHLDSYAVYPWED